MVETIQTNRLWHQSLIVKDLVEQAGFDEKDITWKLTYVEYKGRPIIVSHIFNEHMVVSIKGKDDEDFRSLREGLSKIVGYKPFCKYDLIIGNDITISLPTYEWDKIDPESRYQELSIKENISGLVKI